MSSKQLSVVFDTNVLWTESTNLVSKEVADLIRDFSNHPHVAVTWYLPEVVRLERVYQMRRKWLEVLDRVKALETFLGKSLGVSEQSISKRIEKFVSERQQELGLLTLPLRDDVVDIVGIMRAAAERRPPFSSDGEKGFRDALILGCISGLLRSPKERPVVLVSRDSLMAQAAASADVPINVVENTDGVRGVLAALLDDVDESFIGPHRAKANSLFAQSIFNQQGVAKQLEEKFKNELANYPPGTWGRRNGQWWIFQPAFVRKKHSRLHWRSRVTRDAEAWVLTDMKDPEVEQAASEMMSKFDKDSPVWLTALGAVAVGLMTLQRRVRTVQKGTAVFHVAWSATIDGDQITQPSIDDVTFAETTWEPVHELPAAPDQGAATS